MHDYTLVSPNPTLRPPELALLVEPSRASPVPLQGRTITVGRSPTNDVVLDDRSVSSFHCRIAEEQGSYRIQDLGSRNGTRVNGILVETCFLFPGACLELGRARARCVTVDLGDDPESHYCGLVGRSLAMQTLRSELARFAVRDTPILVQGESGTGKELAARAIHRLSGRSHGPFVAVNCAVLTHELAVNELLGHERGAFTGANSTHRGAFEQANGGTLFLDEVGELDLRVQATLLRVLETGRVRRLGTDRDRDVCVRLIAATNRDLSEAIRQGTFRLDLYHRLAVLRLQTPPLRERLSDLAEIAEALLRRGGMPHRLAPASVATLEQHRWPGNVRELHNVLERACALSNNSVLHPQDLRFDGFALLNENTDERRWQSVVQSYGGSVAATARALGLPRTTLRDRLLREQQSTPSDE